MEPTTLSSSPQKTGLLINRNYDLLLIGQFISLIGDQIFELTIALWIATDIARGKSWAPLAVSGALFAAYSPYFLVGPLAGVFADRWNRRLTMLRMDVLRALLIAFLLIVTGLSRFPGLPLGILPVPVKLALIYSVIVLVSVCSQFFNPARFAVIADIVPEPVQPHAFSLAQTAQGIAVIVGPPLAAPLLFGVGIEFALLIDALSFVASFVLITQLRLPTRERHLSSEREGIGREWVQGLRFVVRNTVLRVLLVGLLLASFGNGTLESLALFFLTRNLHTPAGNAGYLLSVLGAGFILGAIGAGVILRRLGLIPLLKGTLLLYGFFFILFSRLTSFPLALIVIFALGCAQSGITVAASPLILRETPSEMLGRVSAINTPLTVAAQVIGLTLSGYLVSILFVTVHIQLGTFSVGSVDGVLTAAGLLALAGAGYALFAVKNTPESRTPSHGARGSDGVEAGGGSTSP